MRRSTYQLLRLLNQRGRRSRKLGRELGRLAILRRRHTAVEKRAVRGSREGDLGGLDVLKNRGGAGTETQRRQDGGRGNEERDCEQQDPTGEA